MDISKSIFYLAAFNTINTINTIELRISFAKLFLGPGIKSLFLKRLYLYI